jgi:hypothetical protein
MLLVNISMVTTHKDLLFQVIGGSERVLDCQLALEGGINDKSVHHLIEDLFRLCNISSHWLHYYFAVV